MKLGEIAEVRSGLVLSRKKAKGNGGVSYKALNFRAMDPDGFLRMEELDDYQAAETLSPDYVTHIGDLVVRLTSPYTAVLIDEETQGLVIPSNFVVIRNVGRELLPEYLFWLLNTKKVRYDIYENATSNMLGAVKARYYIDFPIRVIPLERQQKIAAMNRLARREVVLLKQLAQEKEIYYEAIIDKIQKEGRNHD